MKSLFRRRYLISLFYLMVVTLGITAWLNIPMELSPDISLPSVTVTHTWGSTSPEVMEQEVTRKVEQIVNRLRDVQKVNSITSEGSSRVSIEFAKHAPVDFRVIELQELLHGLRQDLPASIPPFSISRSVPRELQEMQNFMIYSLSGNYHQRELLEFARRHIRTPLLGLPGIADIEINGAEEPALTVTFDTEITERFNLNQRQILGMIRDQLSWRSAGFTDTADGRFGLMVPPEAASIEELLSLAVPIPGSSRDLILSEFVEITIEDFPPRQIRRINGNTALTISFIKESGADALGLAEQVIEEMNRISSVMPPEMYLRLQLDVTEDLRKQLAELELQSLVSLLSVFVILLLFIRRFRAPFVILGSIVFSIMCSIFILYLMGYTINILTLAGLTVSLGMIIDNAIVVFEQLNPRLPDEREKRIEHVRKELPFAFVPVFGSTLTTVGIFIPLFFALETLQAFLVPLAIALSLTLVSSVLISLTWIPYALIWLTPKSRGNQSFANQKKKTSRFLNRIMFRFFGIRRKARFIIYLALILLIGIPLFTINEPEWGEEESFLKKTTAWYFGNRDSIDPKVGGITYRFVKNARFQSPWGWGSGETIFVNIRPPQGSPLEEIDKIIQGFEALGTNYSEALLYFETTVSEFSGASLRYHINPDFLFDPMPYILYAEAAFLAARTGNVRISVSGLGDAFSTGFGGSSVSFNVRMRGFSFEDLEQTAHDLKRRLERNPRVDNVDINALFFFRDDFQQFNLRFDQEKLIAKGLDRLAVLDAIQMDLNPRNSMGMIEFRGQNMYLLGRNKPRGLYEDDFMHSVRTWNNIQFTLAEVAYIQKGPAMGQIRRENQSYIRQVSFDFRGPHRLGRNFLDGILETLPLPVGTEIDESNIFFSFMQQQDRINTLFILMMALLSVWMIVSALLEKWGDPILVILAVPLSLIGVMAGTLYHNIVFEQGAIAGTLLCVGVVVNNAILLMHERERLRKAGIHGFRSWVYVYQNKMRTVMITTLTTIGGLVPLVIFGTKGFWPELATVVIWGLSFSTILILLLAGMWDKAKLFGSK